MQVSGVDEVTGDYRNRIRLSKSPPVDNEILYQSCAVWFRRARSTFTQWICLLSSSRRIVRWTN